MEEINIYIDNGEYDALLIIDIDLDFVNKIKNDILQFLSQPENENLRK